LDKERAVEVIKQILQRCNHASGKSIKLNLPDPSNPLSKGYQIHIASDREDFLFYCLNRVVDENNLAVKRVGAQIIVYNPKNSLNG
jgi:hypothetical protein